LSTAEALEAITDRGRFELLVISVIRKANKDYAYILQTGVNVAGERALIPIRPQAFIMTSKKPKGCLLF